MPIHIAITRRVRPGCEAEFQQALREFLQTSFAHGGVQGASMLTPPPGSDSPTTRPRAREVTRDTKPRPPSSRIVAMIRSTGDAARARSKTTAVGRNPHSDQRDNI